MTTGIRLSGPQRFPAYASFGSLGLAIGLTAARSAEQAFFLGAGGTLIGLLFARVFAP